MSNAAARALPDLFVVPDFDHGRIEVRFTAPPGCRLIQWKVLQDGTAVASGKTEPCGGSCAEQFTAQLNDFVPWSPDRPFLYVLEMRLTVEGGEDIDVRQRFGMRKIHVEDGQIFLNNKPFYVRGHIRGREAHDHPNLMGCSDREYYTKAILAAKRYGFNLVRFHSRVPPDIYHDLADELGIMTHVEMRKYYGKYQSERELMDHQPHLVSEQDWTEMILRLRNHPSLMAYCLGNEIDSPGTNPEVEHLAKLTKKLDPTRLFIDTCARGQYDRENVDFDVQHMGYFMPFGRHYDMFNTTSNWGIFGSVAGKAMVEPADDDNPASRTVREIHVKRPVIAHEICHYTAYRDLDRLDAKFKQYGAEKPWWIDELKKLVRLKGLEKDYPKMVAASRRFQYIWQKQCIESARRSPLLCGFHFLQLADTERYENSNGLLDCFDDPKDTTPEQFGMFNADTVLVADLPQRTFFEGSEIVIPIWLSHFAADLSGRASLHWQLVSRDGRSIRIAGKMDDFDLDELGLRKICTVHVALPAVDRAHGMTFSCWLVRAGAEPDQSVTRNEWNLWVYPNRPENLPAEPVTVQLRDIDLRRRYPHLPIETGRPDPARLFITDRCSQALLDHLAAGGDAMVLYRIEENRDRKAPRETFYLPSTQDRFKNVIWDRGHNQGGFMRESAALGEFPHDGYIDFQFSRLIDDCDKITLDDFPAPVEPIIQGVDKASRDRFDVFTFKLRELQPGWTMRKFAYLFELAVGKGRLLVTGLNFTGLEQDVPEVCWLFESLMRYVRSEQFQPKASISPAKLGEYLQAKGKAPRIKERMMTQFWQLDDAPLESDRFWKEAEAWIRQG